MSPLRSRTAIWTTVGLWRSAWFVTRCAPSAPKEQKRAAHVGHRRGRTEGLRGAG